MTKSDVDILGTGIVAVAAGHGGYGPGSPYSPSCAYPEYPFMSEGKNIADRTNPAYAGVREALHLLGLDSGRFGTPEWNPLGELVQPGQTVLLKPNFVREFRESSPEDGDCLITHGSVIRAVLDYVFVALKGRGRMVVADASHSDADFDAVCRITGMKEIQEFYRRQAGFNIEVYDLRPERACKIDGVIVDHIPLTGDPLGYTKVNLGMQSAFVEINHLCHLLYGSEYDMSELHCHQHDAVHEYLISKTILSADCVISLPKLKTHKKTGITVNMKNLVGINGNKNWLPHHREGTPAQGGDQFADDGTIHRIERIVMNKFRRIFPSLGPLRSLIAGPLMVLGRRVFGDTNTDTVRSGNWYGNDTTWRTCLDLNRILFYADAEGHLHDKPVRSFWSVVDGIVGGEGNGPLDPTPKPVGLILAGTNPVAVDLVCARLMGFDYRRLPMLDRALADHPFPLVSFGIEDIDIRSDNSEYDMKLTSLSGPYLGFKPHFGWKGHIEVVDRTR